MSIATGKVGGTKKLTINNSNQLRVLGVLVGDVIHEPAAYIKYGYFLDAVKQRFPKISFYNAKLKGFTRLINALLTIHPNQQHWRMRFHQSEFAFRARSHRVAGYLNSIDDHVDVVLQVGSMFDAHWNNLNKPSVIYTDYTAYLSSQKPLVGRSSFGSWQQDRWINLERQALARATHICTRSEFVRTSMIADYGLSPEQITVVGGGVNFPGLPKKLAAYRNNHKPTALFIGRDFYRKGGDLLLRAFAQVRSQIPEAQLLVSTRDPIPNDLPLAGVKLVDPVWDQTKIEALYRQADVFVLPSRLETWGDVLLEAMAYGIPCIGVSDEAMAEIIEDEVIGMLVPPENVEALATALTRLLKDDSLRHRLGFAARQRIEQMYTWDHVAERLTPIIKEAAVTSGRKLNLV